MMKPMSIEDRLGLNKFAVDEEFAHIKVNNEICATCETKPCTWACPALLYSLVDGAIKFDYAGCLECGTCRVVCPKPGALTWEYPQGTMGIQFRYG